jgi:hypothetical protein
MAERHALLLDLRVPIPSVGLGEYPNRLGPSPVAHQHGGIRGRAYYRVLGIRRDVTHPGSCMSHVQPRPVNTTGHAAMGLLAWGTPPWTLCYGAASVVLG